ncbi:hypothetical protein OSH93_19005, partial [Mycobacterium ulcerans]|nr:hypothetical protein [Mycobacterium ulcerans]MEB4435916.1 hypothetical protein [Mycobacterium ulcerans]
PAPIARHQRSSTQLTSLLINNAGALTVAPTIQSPTISTAYRLVILVKRSHTACESTGIQRAHPCELYH